MVTYSEVMQKRTTRLVTRSARPRSHRAITWWQPVVVFAALVGVWYLIAWWYQQQGLSALVPYPHLVVKALFDDTLPDGTPTGFQGQLGTALLNSTEVTVIGLVIAVVLGMAWAFVMAQAKWLENSLYPYAVVLQCVPILALVPLIGALFGDGMISRLIVTVMIALFPMVSNTLFGLQSADRAQRELFQLQGAQRMTVLRKLQLPAALPSIFVGLRTSAGLAVVGAIVGDQFFQRGNGGLGVLLSVTASRLAGPELFATIIVAALLGVAVFLLFGFLARLSIGRWYDFS